MFSDDRECQFFPLFLHTGCFGAVVVDISTKKIVGEGYNHVIANNDPTWHGEIAAIREAGPKLGRPHLNGCVLYTSGQPCPMCMTACMWAHLDRVYYAATFEDVKIYGGFEDEDFMAELGKPEDQRRVPCFELLREEAVEVWKKYKELPDTVHY